MPIPELISKPVKHPFVDIAALKEAINVAAGAQGTTPESGKERIEAPMKTKEALENMPQYKRKVRTRQQF